MSIRCGFFNSIGNDRKYDAEDMGKLFEGVITDGVFGTIDNYKFKIETVSNSMNINILSGKAWFNGKYFEVEKNTYETLTLSAGDSNPRYDAIYIKIDNTQSEGGRVGTLEVQKGYPSSNPDKPIVYSTDPITKIVIGYVLIPARAVSLNTATVISNIGNLEEPNICPYADTAIDPRKPIYLYEGEAIADPFIHEIKVLKSVTTTAYTGHVFSLPEGYDFNNTILLSGMLQYAGAQQGSPSYWVDGEVGMYSSNEAYVNSRDGSASKIAKLAIMKWEGIYE